MLIRRHTSCRADSPLGRATVTPIAWPRPSRRLLLPVASGIALLLAACGGEDGAGPTGPETGAPTRLAFVQEPGDAPLDGPMPAPVQVAVQDSAGNTAAGATHAVALTLESNPGSARLSGTTTVQAVDGIATFDDLVIDEIASGYTLRATAAGLTGTVSEPFDVRFILVRIDTGIDHTCGLTPGGSVYCWGTNGFGQFGAGEAGADHDIPQPGGGDLGWSVVSAGDSHTCGLTPAGEAYCWGQQLHGERGDGQVGTGDTVTVPTPVIGGLTFAGLDAGEDHTCGLAEGGTAYCWGGNNSGELGDGDPPTDKGEPTPVQGGRSFVSVTVGASHTCGLTTAGEAYCWGRNSQGQLGDGNAGTDAETPVAVAGGLNFTALTAGGNHNCGLTGDGKIYCWGSNSSGQLGDGNQGTDRDVPVRVESELPFAALDAGTRHVCALTSAGTAHCWGDNGNGRLGDGNGGTDSDVPVSVAGNLTLEGLTSGDSQSCGWTSNGEAYCWGYNAFGQLGDGNLGTHSDRPVRVVAPE